jgi:2-keto-3-deoxy-L-rhamnonate aldolase RhmA
LIEFEHDDEVHHFILTLALRPIGDSTLVSWHQTFKSAEEYQQIADFLAQANEPVLERLRVEVQRLM